MAEYQPLLADIYVPNKWPVATKRKVIIELVKKAIRYHPFDQRVVITVDNVSALITGGYPRWILEQIEHENNGDACYIDLLLPVGFSISKLEPDGSYLEENSVPFLYEDLVFDHPILRLYGLTSGHRIAVAAPNIRSILQRMNVTGEDIYNYTFKTTYKNPKGLVPQQYSWGTFTEGPCASMEKISDGEWNIVWTDRLIKPHQKFWSCRSITETLKRSPLVRRRYP